MSPFRFPHSGDGALIMGIINLSPESFYETSRCVSLQQAIHAAEKMIDEGADMLDIGAESSRPGSVPLSEKEELKRLLPVIESLTGLVDIPVSVDTYKPAVAYCGAVLLEC